MKTSKLKLFWVMTFTIATTTFFGQNWRLGGNTIFPFGGVNSVNGANNFLGTDAVANFPLKLGTVGFNRMLIANGGTANADGRIGIGNNLSSAFSPTARLHLHQTGGFNSMRFSTNGTGSTGNDGFEMGMGDDGNVAFISNELDANFSWYNRGVGPGLLGRMRLYDGGLGMDKGRLVISNDLPFTFTPQARLHIYQMVNDGNANGNMIRTDGAHYVVNQMQMFTNDLERFKLFIPPNTSNIGYQATQEEGYQFFNTGGAFERFRIFNNTLSPSTPVGGGVAIHLIPWNPITQPGALLHIGQRFESIGAPTPITGLTGYFGWRNWMSVGTFNFSGTDNMYIGLKEEPSSSGPPEFPQSGVSDRQDAIINWGDNTDGLESSGPDYLRFLNTQSYDPGALAGFARHKDGLEVARFAPNSNFGIGNFYNNPLFVVKDPVRRLEVLSDKTDANDDGNAQFRLTHTQQGNVGNNTIGKFTDFHTNNLGNLVILTKDNTQANNATQNLKERFVGINTTTPGNTVEINSQYTGAATANGQPQDPTVGVNPTGWSGLRFTDLNSTSIPQLNPGAGLLSINENGDVIYVPGGTGGAAIGNACGATANPLTSNWEIPLGNQKFYFTGQSTTNENVVAIGFPCGNNLPGKFNVLESQVNYNDSRSYAGYFINDNTDPSQSVTNRQIGVYAQAIKNEQVGMHLGGVFKSWGGKWNAGVVGVFEDTDALPYFDEQIGGLFLAQPVNGSTDRGHAAVVGKASNSTVANYGVIGDAPSPTGTNTATNINYAGFFNGAVYYSQLITVSDKKLKNEITAIDNGLDIVSKLHPVSFRFSPVAREKGLSVPYTKQYGFIAQEVADVVPDLVIKTTNQATYDASGNVLTPATEFLGLDYNGFIGIMASAIQEVNNKVDKSSLSDQQVKTNITGFNALNKIKQLTPVRYNFTNQNVPQLSFDAATDYGFVAQQMETVYPELIDTIRIHETTDSLGNIVNASQLLKTVNYKAMSALLTRAIQEQQFTIDSLKHSQDSINNSVQNQLAQLTSLINSCCQNTNSRTQTTTNIAAMDVELSDKDIVVLNQNVPNPFAEQTTITYNIPEKAGFAQIIFNDMKGQIIKVIDVKCKGKGQLNVFANDLSTGMYTYSLYVDGKLIDTKKMVKTE